ncbi:YciI family protein [Paenibacillus motobuensis]|uniref:YciI family protein n=1 Tax=Paenibacillus motobuensis TaxID=295324 RepID=A0ABN0Y2W9_9BACL
MRFMLIVKANGFSETGIHYSQEYVDAMKGYKRSLAKVGALLTAEELNPSSRGIRICYPSDGGQPKIQAGPFPVDQELVAEFVVIDVKTEEEALEWAIRMPIPTGLESTIELRSLQENVDSLSEPGIHALEADLLDYLHMLRKL